MAVMECSVQRRSSQVGGQVLVHVGDGGIHSNYTRYPPAPQASRHAPCTAEIAQEHDWRSLLRSRCPLLGALLGPSYQKGRGQFNPSPRNRGMKRERSFVLHQWEGANPGQEKERSKDRSFPLDGASSRRETGLLPAGRNIAAGEQGAAVARVPYPSPWLWADC